MEKLGAGRQGAGGENVDGAELLGGAASWCARYPEWRCGGRRGCRVGRVRVDGPLEDVLVGDVKPYTRRADVIAHGVAVLVICLARK